MTTSMTGFGRGEFTIGTCAYQVELRSYNSRFLDTKIRMPWTDGVVESRVLSAIRERITRGRIELSIREGLSAGGATELRLNEALARDLAPVLERLSEVLGCDLPTAAGLVPPLRELVVVGAQVDSERIWAQLAPGVRTALDRLVEMKRGEGLALAEDLRGHLEQVELLVAEIRELAAGEPARSRDRLTERLKGLAGGDITIDPGRLAQEVAILADKHDVCEELSRADSHLHQLRQILAADGAVGRKLEFMLQELNRELNTIASKSASAEIAHRVVEGKGCLEKMREQAQNIE